MVAEQAGIKEGDYILDVRDREEKRSMHIEILNGTGMVEARDLTEMKVELIRENISRMGFENIRAVQQDATCFDADSEEKSRCSDRGSSVFRPWCSCEEDRSEV